MTRRQWSLVIVLILVNYLIFTQLFNRILNNNPEVSSATRTPVATFTPTTALQPELLAPVVPPSPTPIPVDPSPTSTFVNPSDEQARAATATIAAATEQAGLFEQPQNSDPDDPASTSTPTTAPVDQRPLVTASASTVNLRGGPGTNYAVVGSLPLGQSLEIVGRNANSSWWQVSTTGGLAWVAATVTTASNVDINTIPIVQPPPAPATNTPVPPPNTPVPAAPPPPQQQYTIRNVFGQVNEAITQIRGEIRDGAGNPVNGVRVRVRSGSFCTVSVPSGHPGVYPAGVYDILLDGRAKPGQWQVAIVNGPSDPSDFSCNDGLSVLSEEVTVPTDSTEGVVFVEWQKNF